MKWMGTCWVETELVLREAPPDLNVTVSDPGQAAVVLRKILAKKAQEHFVVLMLNTRHRVIGYRIASVGTLNGCLVHPRDVFGPVLQNGAVAAIVVGHNHPSNDPSPSPEDVALTRRLTDVGKMLGIELLDHVIVTKDGHHSLREGRFGS